MWPLRRRRCPRRCPPGLARCCPLPPSWLAAPSPAVQPVSPRWPERLLDAAAAAAAASRAEQRLGSASHLKPPEAPGDQEEALPAGGVTERDRAPSTVVVAETHSWAPQFTKTRTRGARLHRQPVPSFLPFFFPSFLWAPAAKAGIVSSSRCRKSSSSSGSSLLSPECLNPETRAAEKLDSS